MTATQIPQTQPTPPPVVDPSLQPTRRSRTLPTAIGAVLASVGAIVAISGAGVLAVAGDDGTVGSGTHQISTPTAALVTGTAEFDSTDAIAEAIGQPELGVRATALDGGPDKFVGIGPAKDVDRYLRGVEIDRVDDVDLAPFVLHKERRSGNATATRPGDQTFWVAQSSGRDADVDWKVRDGDYKVVVMNADGSREVTTDAHFEAGLPYLSTYALAIMLSGVVAVAAGIALLVRKEVP